MDNKSSENAYWTQAEVAQVFRVTESTIKNWRERGLLPFLRFPGSRRVIYPAEAIREVRSQFTYTGKEVPEPEKQPETRTEKPGASSRSKQEWRV